MIVAMPPHTVMSVHVWTVDISYTQTHRTIYKNSLHDERGFLYFNYNGIAYIKITTLGQSYNYEISENAYANGCLSVYN